MFICRLFRKLNKTAKLKGTNVDTKVGIKIVWFEFAKRKGAKIMLHVKSANFRAAKLNVFTVL